MMMGGGIMGMMMGPGMSGYGMGTMQHGTKQHGTMQGPATIIGPEILLYFY